MSTHSLALKVPSTTLPGLLKRSAAPIHAAFASVADLLAVLWEPGILNVFDLKTRLGPGRGKVIDPVSVWSGTVGEGSSGSYRQVIFDQAIREDNTIRLGVLGSRSSSGRLTDTVFIVDIVDGETMTAEVALPAHNGRLVPAQGIFWESPDRHLYEGGSIYARPRILLDPHADCSERGEQRSPRSRLVPRVLLLASARDGHRRRERRGDFHNPALHRPLARQQAARHRRPGDAHARAKRELLHDHARVPHLHDHHARRTLRPSEDSGGGAEDA